MPSRPEQRREVRVAPHIYQVLDQAGLHVGWRVYVSRAGALKPKRFPPATTREQLQVFVETFNEESDKLQRERRAIVVAHRGSLKADAARYLALKTVRAMPSFKDREREIARWVQVFGTRPRLTITARQIDEQLQAFRDGGLSGSTVNKLRTALMSLWTRLDGRGAANPVRETLVFPESEELPRGQSYALLVKILDAVPNRSRPVKGVKGSTKRGSLSKVRLELMAWTGFAPIHVARLTPAHFSLDERWYTTPRRKKGKQPRFPRPVIRKRMTTDAEAAFRRFVALKAWGPFDRRALRHTWFRAVAKVERAMRKELRDRTFTLPRIRLYDIRHSFGTAAFQVTQNLGTVGALLDTTERTARRYALAAVPQVLSDAMTAFERATTRGPAGKPFRPLPTPKQANTRAHRRRRTARAATPKQRQLSRKRSVK